MDYYSFPRKQLQALCKKHGIPANSTNVSMADALTALLNGNGNINGNINKFDEGFQEEEPASQDRGDDSVLTEVSDMPRRCKQSKRLVIAKEDESTEEPVVIHIEETPVAPKGKGAKSANKTRERRSRTTARSRKVDIVTMDESLHSSEVDESSDAVTAINSAKVERSGPVKGTTNARARMAKSCCRTDEIEDPERLEDRQRSYEKEEKTDETNCKLVEEVPETRTNGRSSRKKIDKVQVEEALEDSSSQGENDACKKEMPPIGRRSTRAKASKVVDTHPSQNRSSSIKKTGNAESIKKTDGSLHSSEVEESSDVVPALNSAKFERTGPIRGSRNARTFMTKSFFRTDENEDLERLEDTQGSDEKKEKTDEIKCKLVEEAPKNRTKGRSSGKKDDKVEVKEAIEDRSTQGENNASRKEITPICRRSTRASKVVDTHPSQNRSSSVKKIGNAECIKKTPGTMSKARKVKLSPMAENFTDNGEEGDQAEEVVEEVVKVPTKSPHKEEVAKPEYSCNNDVKSSVMTRRALRSNQKDSTGILNKDALEESTSKVKRMLTRRGRKPVRNVHQRTGSETQEESNSDSEGSDVKQERESYGKFTRKAVRENLGNDEHKCTEEIEANLNVKEDGFIENEAREDVKSIDKTESEEMKCEIILQPELNMCQIFDQKHVSSGISRTQNTENESIEEISNTSKSSKDQSATISESYGSRIVKELNVCSGKVSMKQGIASAGMTPLSRPGEGKFNSLPSVDQLVMLKCSTASIVAEESATKNDALSSLEAQVGELIGIEDGEVGEKMVSDGVTVAESHNATRPVIMHVQLKGEEDALFSHIVDSVKVEETKKSLHHNDHKMNNFNIQELKCRRDLSSRSAEAPSPVEKKDDIMHSESDRSSIEAIQNPFEVHEKVVNAEPGNVAGLAVNISAEECLDPEAVYSSDLKIAGKQTELQLIPTNLVEKINWNTTEANLQSSSFLIDEVSDLECTKEENQDGQDCNFATGFANSEGQLLEVSETIQSAEYCQGLEEEILSDLENTKEEILDVQDSELYFKVVSDISQIQDRQVTGFANAEGQLLETSEKFQSAEDCQVPEEEILSDLENTEEENLDVQDSDLSFKVVSDICQVQDRQVTGFANAESQVLDSSVKIQRAEYCQGMEEEILSDLENTEEEILDVQDSDLSFKVVSDISQIQDRQVTGFANAEGQVSDFANAEGEDCQVVMEEILNDLDNSEVENQVDHSFMVVPNILQVPGFANSESKSENGGVCKDTQEGKLQTLTSLPEEPKDSATEESIGYQETCNDTMEGKHPSKTSSSDNASEAEPVERVRGSSAQAVGEVEIGNFSCKLDGRQKEACQAQVCISHQRSQDSGVHPEVCSNTSCFAEVLVHSNEENSVIAIQKHGTSDNDRKTIDKSKDGKLDVLNENSSSRSNNVPLLCAKEEMNLQNQISEKQVLPTAHHRLESDMMATVGSFEIGNVGRKLGVEEATCAFPEEKYLPSFATKGSEQTDIKEPEFAVEASYKGKMPIVRTLCEKINSMALDGAASNSPLALVKPDQVEKAPNTIIKDSRQQRVMLPDLTDQSRKDGQNTIIDDGFQIAPLESAGCGLQIGKENPPDLDALSLRKLRALVKEKKMLRNNVRKEKERFVLRDLTSIELEERKNVSDNTRL